MKLKIKETYLILLIVISLISLGVYSTYALFTASTEISDVVGISTTLDIGKSISEYEIVSVDAGETKLIELNVVNSSSNTIYYGAWYKIVEGNQEDIDIGLYTEVNSNSSSGTLTSSSSINLLVGITNNSDTTITVYLGVKGSVNNELNLSNDKTLLSNGWTAALLVTDDVLEQYKITSITENISKSYSYSSNTQTDTLEPGTYKLEVWGAQGGSNGGKGGYSYGTLTLTTTTNIFVNVGGTSNIVSIFGTNGGGHGEEILYNTSINGSIRFLHSYGYSGGGATDIKISNNSLYSRVIVAGGGSGYSDTDTTSPSRGFSNQGSSFGAGTDASGGSQYTTNAGGGGGWYGGLMNNGGSGWAYTEDNYNIWQNDKPSDASNWLLNSSYYLTNVGIFGGDSSFTDYDGTTVTGHSGDGYAKITGNKIIATYTIPQLKGLTSLNIPIGTSFDLTNGLELICENNQTTGCSITSTSITDTSTLEVGTYTVIYTVTGTNGKNYLFNRTVTINAIEPNSPDLVEGLIPVMYNGTSWVVADSTNTDSNYKWYDYDNKLWANAVLVTETKRNSLIKDSNGYVKGQTIGDTYDDGTLAFYVWIPRYKYKVWNINKVIGTDSYDAYNTGIDIIFESGTNSTGTISCTYSYAATSSTAGSPNEVCTGNNGDYYTHPAFTFGTDELRGIWIGKFEVSNDDSIVKILPSVRAWTDSLGDHFREIQNMQTSSNIYGLNTSRMVVDSHVITNYDWGAASYLTNSKYGRCTNGSCTNVSVNERGFVNENTNTKYTYTGYGQDTGYGQTLSYYNTTLGMDASTTGNITGIYDMSGGEYETTMGNISSTSGSYKFSSTSGDGFPATNNDASYWYNHNIKYVTTYAYGTSSTDQEAYNRGRLGDATSEVQLTSSNGWYNTLSNFSYANVPYFSRGGDYDDSNAGIFSIYQSNGNFYSTRAVLVSLNST